ncbi:restriction endonuclease subunit S [Luteimonas sp. MC1825]|uniref:restriction endonuclease subunit S n=1 Tax=Luteimonas sp. MC1825 TaxID=2761107 RepID=UPI00161771E2|nr:restriction endonuclease subunit S [Luteimonas sp. MC1825]MBB6598796.1 restriction endonuclease subunit S [Luteimonas sp. MC1825]QOC88952.1 restriction endonuclease subunit S [Luteimonas sp. MC1825]
MSLPRYPEYKDSGVEWLGYVPEHWEICALKRIASLRSGESITAASIEPEGVYPVYGGNGLRGYTNGFTHEGHFALVGRQGALCGNVNYANGKFWASEHAVVATPIKKVTTTWLGELLRAMNLNQYSVSAAQPGLSVEAMENLGVPYPPIGEQLEIAAFLEREGARIDALIAEQEKLLALLAEKRQATISHAVTRGLDPNVPMKDSGIPWLGEVPAHWDLLPCRTVVSEQIEKNDGGVNEDYLSLVANVGVMPYAEKGDVGNKKPEDLSKCKLVEIGDLVINSMNYGIGSYGLSGYKGVCSPVYIVLRTLEDRSIKEFVYRIFQNRDFQLFAQSFGNGILAHRSAIGWDTIKNLRVAVPGIEEQCKIVEFIEKVEAESVIVTRAAGHAIELFRECRSALISAAVTGQIDVRGLVEADAA